MNRSCACGKRSESPAADSSIPKNLKPRSFSSRPKSIVLGEPKKQKRNSLTWSKRDFKKFFYVF